MPFAHFFKSQPIAGAMPEVIFPGPEGRLEGRFSPGPRPRAPVAMILHPHPHGNTMNNAIVQALLESLQQPLLGTTLIMPGETEALNDADAICDRLGKQIELVIDGGACSMEPTTVIDLTGADAELVRQGRGDAAIFGL